MKSFLYLDNWHERQRPTRFDRYLMDSDVSIDVKCTNHGEFPESMDYCGAFVSPSFSGAYDDETWIHRTHSILQNLADARVPMLGLCFGSQILASALVGKDQVFVREEREKGFGHIRMTNDSAHDVLTKTLPTEMSVFHWHRDEVRACHDDIVVLANSNHCANQLWRWAHGPVWGVQPHPELGHDDLLTWFAANRTEFEAGGLNYSSLVTGYHDSDNAFGILKNFVEFVQQPPEKRLTVCSNTP